MLLHHLKNELLPKLFNSFTYSKILIIISLIIRNNIKIIKIINLFISISKLLRISIIILN